MTLPSLRRFGAEHSPLECVCGRASPVVSTEEQRFIPMKCLTCAVTLASNKPSLSVSILAYLYIYSNAPISP